MRTTLAEKLSEFAAINKDVVLLVGDLGFGVFEKYRELFPERFINCGIAEQNMASVAAGLALQGKKVFVYSIGNFNTLRCYEQIRNDVDYHNLDVNFVSIGAGVEYGPLGMSHHTTEDIGVFRLLPNMSIYSPFNIRSCAMCLDEMYESTSPTYMRLNKKGIDEAYRDCNDLELEEIQSGQEIAVISTGAITEEAIKAAYRGRSGIGIYAVAKLKEPGEGKITTILNRYKKIITLEEHNTVGGLGSMISDLACENRIPIALKKLGINKTYTGIVGKQNYLRECYSMDSSAIIQLIESML